MVIKRNNPRREKEPLQEASDIFEDKAVEVEAVEPIKVNTRLLKVADIINDIKPLEWLIEDIMPQDGLFELYGASGSFKSFIVLDMLYCISNGIEYHGKETKKGAVVYVAGESANGVKIRLNALQKHYNKNLENFFMLPMPSNLMDDKEMELLANDIKAISKDKVALVVFDTLHRNSAGSDENSSNDFAIILSNIDKQLFQVSHLIGWVHHTGLNKDNSRGTSSRYGAIDLQIKVNRDTNEKSECSIVCTKMKESEEFKTIFFGLNPIELELKDKHGNNLKSLIPHKIEKTETTKKTTLSTNDNEVLGILRLLIESEGILIDDEFKNRESIVEARMINIDRWRVEAYKVITTSGADDEKKKKEAKQKAFKRSLQKLQECKKILTYDDNVVVVDMCRFRYQSSSNTDTIDIS